MTERKHTPLSGNAEYSRLGRDLFWKFYAFNDNNEFIKVIWDGYGNHDFLSFLLYNTIVNLNKEK